MKIDSVGHIYPMTLAQYKAAYDNATCPEELPDWKRDGTPFAAHITKLQRWNSSRLHRGLWASDAYRALRAEITASLLSDPIRRAEILEAISRGVQEANEQPLTQQLRDQALLQRQMSPPGLLPDAEEAARAGYGSGHPSKYDRDGYVYVVCLADTPWGPFKIGSSFNAAKRKTQLEEGGYWCFWPAGCKLRTMTVVHADYFRRVEMKTHELLRMDAKHKRQFGELCFRPLEVILKCLHVAKMLVAIEVKMERDRQLQHFKGIAEFPERMQPLMYEQGEKGQALLVPVHPECYESPELWDECLYYTSREQHLHQELMVMYANAFAQEAAPYIVSGDGGKRYDPSDPKQKHIRDLAYQELVEAFTASPDCVCYYLREPRLAELRAAFKELYRIRKSVFKRRVLPFIDPINKRRKKILLNHFDKETAHADNAYQNIRAGAYRERGEYADQYGMPADKFDFRWSQAFKREARRQPDVMKEAERRRLHLREHGNFVIDRSHAVDINI